MLEAPALGSEGPVTQNLAATWAFICLLAPADPIEASRPPTPVGGAPPTGREKQKKKLVGVGVGGRMIGESCSLFACCLFARFLASYVACFVLGFSWGLLLLVRES